VITPDAQPLSAISLPQIFELASIDDPMVTAVCDLANAVGALGGEKWLPTTVIGSDTRWLVTTVASMSNEEMEVELLLRVVEPQGRSDGPANQLWQINLTVGIYCECWTNHGTHYVRDMRWQAASPAGLRNAVAEIVDVVERWREQRRDAAWWRDNAGLPDRAAGS
jgi:hypothetical protein